jgi:hypothetical protein
MRAEAIRERLATGPATWRDLCEASGLSEARVMAEVKKLEYAGCAIESETVTVLTLRYDPEHPVVRTCAWPGCETTLHHRNATGYCGAHLPIEAARRWAQLPREKREALAEDICDDGEVIAVLFDHQLSLESVMVGV